MYGNFVVLFDEDKSMLVALTMYQSSNNTQHPSDAIVMLYCKLHSATG